MAEIERFTYEVDDQLSSITEWIIQRLNDFEEFRENYPDLGWKN